MALLPTRRRQTTTQVPLPHLLPIRPHPEEAVAGDYWLGWGCFGEEAGANWPQQQRLRARVAIRDAMQAVVVAQPAATAQTPAAAVRADAQRLAPPRAWHIQAGPY